jgi:hypothetical protein
MNKYANAGVSRNFGLSGRRKGDIEIRHWEDERRADLPAAGGEVPAYAPAKLQREHRLPYVSLSYDRYTPHKQHEAIQKKVGKVLRASGIESGVRYGVEAQDVPLADAVVGDGKAVVAEHLVEVVVEPLAQHLPVLRDAQQLMQLRLQFPQRLRLVNHHLRGPASNYSLNNLANSCVTTHKENR